MPTPAEPAGPSGPAGPAALPPAGVLTPVTAHARLLLAPNPSPMTLDGTNTWLLGVPGGPGIVVDPGPADESHLAAVMAAGRVELVLLTHRHLDHSESAADLAARAGAPVLALDPALRRPAPDGPAPGYPDGTRVADEVLRTGDELRVAGITLEVIRTPGHTSDSVSFLLREDDAVLTGDTVLGRGTTVVAHPDGELGPYLDSLARLRELGDATLLPGHGPVLPSAGRAAAAYLAHREQRLEQVRVAVADGCRTAPEVVERVYADVDRALWPAAELSVRAQLAYLDRRPPGGHPTAPAAISSTAG